MQYREKNKSGDAGLFGLLALSQAYTDQGAIWLSEINGYLQHNVQIASAMLQEKLPQLTIVRPQASYLLWLDFSAYFQQQADIEDWCIAQGLGLTTGVHFGSAGRGFMRMNIALPRPILVHALNGVTSLVKEIR